MTVERINVNYKSLWKMLIDRDVWIRICVAMICGLDDIVEIERGNGGM